MHVMTQIENDLTKLEGSIQAAKKCKAEILQAIEAAKAGKQETVRGGMTALHRCPQMTALQRCPQMTTSCNCQWTAAHQK